MVKWIVGRFVALWETLIRIFQLILPSHSYFYFFNPTPIGSAACQSEMLVPPPSLTPPPPTASQKDPLSAGGQVSMPESFTLLS